MSTEDDGTDENTSHGPPEEPPEDETRPEPVPESPYPDVDDEGHMTPPSPPAG